MEKNDVAAQTRRSGLMGRLHAGSVAGHRKLLRFGFAAALGVISLAGFYALYGGSGDRKLETSSSQQSQQVAEETKEATVDTTDQQRVEQTGNDAQQQSQSGRNTGQASSSSRSTTTVTVNGQRVDVPENGYYSQTIDTGSGQATINSQSSHSSSTSDDGSSSSSSSSSSLNVNVSSGGSTAR